MSSNHTSTADAVEDVLGVSRSAVQRIFRAARENFGVKIIYQNTNQPYAGASEFSVEDWSVFNRTPMRRFLES